MPFQVEMMYTLAGEINKMRGYKRAIRDNNGNIRGRRGTGITKGSKAMIRRHNETHLTYSKTHNASEDTSGMATGHPGYFTAEGKRANDTPVFSDDEVDPLEIPFQKIDWWMRPWKL